MMDLALVVGEVKVLFVVVLTIIAAVSVLALGARAGRVSRRALQRVAASERAKVVGLRCTLGAADDSGVTYGDQD